MISNIGPIRSSLATPYAGQSVIRRSRVAGVSGLPVVNVQPTFQTHQTRILPQVGLATSSVLPAQGFRNSVVIDQSQIPQGMTVIRVENPAEYNYHGTPQTIHQTKKVMAEPAPPVYQSTGIRRRSACPWWVWALLGLLGLLLLAGLLWGLFSALGGNKAEEEIVEPIVDTQKNISNDVKKEVIIN